MPQDPEFDRIKPIMKASGPQTLEMVCGRAITQEPPYPNASEYKGRRIVFCTHYCLEAFQADPDRFYTAHSRNKGLSGNCPEKSQKWNCL